jgi:DNA helicase-2/ATP-dependent DNA helicase PcrA
MPKGATVSAKKETINGGTRTSAPKIFESEYNKLNEAQRKAVDTIEGPVMVIAGPGTGKTQTLAMRVANILKKTQMRPSNILCLTFSVSGATAMRDRLRLLIGADAYGVTVSTIHGFCQSIIANHPSVFEEWSAKEQIGDMEKYQELNNIIDDLVGSSKLLNPKDPYGRDADILSRISQIKREGKTVEDLKKVLKEFEGQMHEKNERARTDSGRKKNLLAVEKFADFIEIFKRYQEMLAKKGRYDYDDMILFALRALQENDWLLAGLQERYQYVLVDEAQDTNGAQWKVIETLTTYPLDHEPNLFVVGDDDQAIYRFQGANLRNMLSFHERFPKAPVIPLTVSYRSTQVILDAAQSLIEKNEERLVGKISGLNKDLRAFTQVEGTAPQLLRAASDSAEHWLIADILQERIEQGIAPQDIAVLTQTNAELFPIYDILRAREIPVILHGKADLLGHPLVAEALAMFQALVHLRSNSDVISALAVTAFHCHPADLSRLALLSREQKKDVQDVLLDLERSDAPFLRKDALIAARDAVLDLAHKVDNRTVLNTVEGVLAAVSRGDAKDPLDLAAIEAFFHYAKAQCLNIPTLSFRGFLKELEFFADPQYGQARLTYEIPHLVTEGVQLMTAHQSKGLEFHTVLLTNFRDGHWDKRRKPSGVSIPEDLLFGWDTDQKKFEQHQDERRVAFVAMTRAERELLFLCPQELSVGQKHKPLSPSAFFAEAGTLPEASASLKQPEEASLLLLHPVRELDAEMQAYVRERLENFALSATSLTRFLRDPQEFLRIDLLGQPEHFDEATTRSLGYGSAIHWALREWGTAVQRGENFDEKQMIEAFRWYLAERTILTEQQRKDLDQLGSIALPRYYSERLNETKPILYSLERDYRARLGDIALKGKIDRIDQLSKDSGHVLVIDYKTGAAKSEREIRGGLDIGEISRTDEGDKFRQMAFYSLLLEQGDPMITPMAYALEFIGERGEDPERVELSVSDQEKDQLRSLIKDVWAKIQNLDFSPL